MNKKSEKPSFVLNLDLKTEMFQEFVLDKRFEIGRKIYNSLLGIGNNRLKELTKTNKWKENQKKISEIHSKEKDENKIKKLCEPYFEIRNNLLMQFNLSEYSLHDDVKLMQHKFKKNLDSMTCQKIATRVWKALSSVLYSDGEEVHFKKYYEGLNSLEGKTNSSGIRYKIKTNMLEWNGLKIKVQDKLNSWEQLAIQSKIKYSRITRKFVRGKYKYTLQLVLDGIPPMKTDIITGKVKNDTAIGECGIDIGTQTIAYTTNNETHLLELAPNVVNLEKEKRKIQRYMDRSKRKTNSDNFNEDGTIKKGRLKWNFSNRYKKARAILKDIQRKQKDIRKLDHEILANKIISKADTIKVETMNFKALQKKAKKTEKNEKGKFKKKKRFGKSIGNKAPGMFLTILKRKLKSKGGLYFEVNTIEVKASQYNHFIDTCIKKKLSERWNYFDYNNSEIKIQRDLYSSFLIKNVKSDLKTIDRDKCIKDFDEFIKHHNEEIECLRVSEKKLISSMGIKRK